MLSMMVWGLYEDLRGHEEDKSGGMNMGCVDDQGCFGLKGDPRQQKNWKGRLAI
jgi:hypothetical protein